MFARAAVAAALLTAGFAWGQTPSDDWRTTETRHFRVHYTAEAEEWALRAASRLESIRDRVVETVGYAPPQKIDVIVADPMALPNGSALPLLQGPRLVFWTTPPGPESIVGDFRDWGELLSVHEVAHLVHMLRPRRSGVPRGKPGGIFGPLTLGAPRWAHEGYATLIEGDLTASGRPNGDARAAILRTLARAGKLPTYRRLSSDPDSWMGMSLAYLGGSAFLEWLGERSGTDSYTKVWARMTARTRRSFEQAFTGVYGAPPEKLWDRFRSELTWKAVEVERRLEASRREGDLWQDLRWNTGEPAVSPQGDRISAVVRGRRGPSTVVVWSTGGDAEGEKRWKERVARMVRRDPEDVAPVPPPAFARKPLQRLVSRDGLEPFAVRFMPDGGSLLFTSLAPDAEGTLRADLYRWKLGARRAHRVTRRADVRSADPAPDGRWAVAVRSRHGRTQLVRVDLESGAVSGLTDPSVENVVSSPRVSPDGRRVAFLRHERGTWRLMVRDLDTGRESEIVRPAGTTIAFPAWSRDGGTVYASLGRMGLIDVAALPVDRPGSLRWITRSASAALAPEPTPDGAAVYFLGLEHDGLDLRRIATPTDVEATDADAAIGPDLAPATRPVPPQEPASFAVAEVRPGRRYGLGNQEPFSLVGFTLAPSARTAEIGLRLGDVVGRFDFLAIGGFSGSGGPRGGTLGVSWRGWPVSLSARIFRVTERPFYQPQESATLVRELDGTTIGGEIRAEWERGSAAKRVVVDAGVLAARLQPDGREAVHRTLVDAGGSLAWTPSRGPWSIHHGASVRVEIGRTAGDRWQRYGGSISWGLLFKSKGILLEWERRTARGVEEETERLRLGGIRTSLLPESAVSERILVPALPVSTLVGAEHEARRVRLAIDWLPLFYERHRVWERGGPKGDWLSLAGLAFDLKLGPQPAIKIPGLRLRAGVAHVLSGALEGRSPWWVSVAWDP